MKILKALLALASRIMAPLNNLLPLQPLALVVIAITLRQFLKRATVIELKR